MTRLILASGLIATSLVGGIGWNVTQAHASSPLPPPPATLTGEHLTESFTGGNINSVSCQNDLSGTFTFSAHGTASAPYPGTFTETGTATVTPNQTVSAFSASFTIKSTNGATVTGTKTFSSSGDDGGLCLIGVLVLASTNDTYQATITTSNGTYSDAGTTTPLVVIGENSSDNTFLHEPFTSSQQTTTLIPPVCTSNCGVSATPELSSGELLATGLLPIGAVLLYRRRRARHTLRQ